LSSTYTEYLKCDLTDAEIADTARELARANARRQAVEQQKKEVDSQLKSEIEAANTVISRLSTLINTGHEYRNIDCRVELDTPEPGQKRVVRLDTGEEVSVKRMTDADRQMVIDLQTKAEESEAAEEEARQAEIDKVIVTPPPVLQALPEPEVAGTQQVYEKMISEAIDLHSGLASAVQMGGTHQKRKRGKEAAAGDQ
jgi:hypothetical protein